MGENSETYRVDFVATSTKTNLKGLDDAIKKLGQLDAAYQSLQAHMSAMTSPVALRKTSADMRESIANAQKLGRFGKGPGGSFNPPSLKPADMAKALGYDPKQVQNFLTQGMLGGKSKAAQVMRQHVREVYSVATGEFRSQAAAAKGMAMFTKNFDPKQDPMAALRMMFGGQGAPAGQHVPPAAREAIKAQAKKASAAMAAAIEKEDGGAGGGSGKGKEFARRRAQIQRDLDEAVRDAQGNKEHLTSSPTQIIEARRHAANQMRGLVGADKDSKQGADALGWAAKQEQRAVALAQKESLKAGTNLTTTRKALDKAKESGNVAEQKRLQREVGEYEQRKANFERMQNLGTRRRQATVPPWRTAFGYTGVRDDVDMEQQAALAMQDVKLNEEIKRKAEGGRRKAATLQAIDDFKAQGGEIYEGRRVAKGGRLGGTVRDVKGRLALPGGQFRILNASIGDEDAELNDYMRPSGSRGQKDRMTNAIEGLSPRNMAANILKVTEWAAAVGVLYKSVELARYSLTRLEETGLQMAHLSIVFRGVGGDVRSLTGDIINLAAEQGRNTDEAMESATEWARLGGDRATINEEVRVSAEAANIANMHMGETTKQLMSLMHIYHLEAGDLNGTLGSLVNTSLKYNVTLEELFIGLDRSAAAAKIAGVGLNELQAMIGVVVGATGQTGSMTGNSMKYIFQELNKSDVQRQLRGFGVESLGNNLEQKPAGQILGELSGKWGSYSERSQQRISGILGGRFNAARVPIVMENYPQILKLAIDAQLNLNKAQEANVKILDTLKAQLAGLHTQYDRLVMNAGGTRSLTTLAGAGKNVVGAVADQFASASGGLTDEDIQRSRNSIMDEAGKSHGLRGMGYASMALLSTLNRPFQQLEGAAGWGIYKSEVQSPGIVDYMNRGVPGGPAAMPGSEAFQQSMADMRRQADTSALRERSMDLGLEMVRNGGMSLENANSFAGIMQQMNGGQRQATGFLDAFKGGSKTGMLGYLQGAREQALDEKVQLLRDQRAAVDSKNAEIQKDKADVGATILEKTKAGQSHEEEDAKLRSYNAELQKNNTLLDDNAAAYESMEGELDAVQISQQKYISLLKEQEDLMESIDTLFKSVPAKTPSQALEQQAASLQAQVDMLVQSQQKFQGSPDSNTAEGAKVNVAMSDQIKKLQAELDSANSYTRRTMAERQTEMQTGVRAGENFGISREYGIDTAMKQMNKAQALRDDMAKIASNLPNETGQDETNDTGRYLGEQAELYKTILNLQQRRAEVERDIKQLVIDQNKEFMRTFYGDGPAQMLQKLAAFRMAFNGDGSKRPTLSQGGFFGLSPEMRQNYGMLNPTYNPQMIELENERHRLEQHRRDWQNAPSMTPPPSVNKALSDIGKVPGLGTGTLVQGGILDAATKIFETAASRCASALDGLTAKLSQISGGKSATPTTSVVQGGQLPSNAQSGGNGGARGYRGHGAEGSWSSHGSNML